MRYAFLAVITLLLAACAAPPPAPPRSGFAFALIGDMPYSEREAAEFDRLLDAVNADRTVSFVMHAGDIKSGSEPCSDELLRTRYAQLQRVRTALVYTPGDNEWTDCHRAAAGRFNPLERLAFLRALFFRDPTRTTGLQPFPVESQASVPARREFVENALFERDRVVFATLHIVGSDNDLVPWQGFDAHDTRAQPRADRVAEVERRTAAAMAWIDRAFEVARRDNAAAVFLLMQANPRFDLSPVAPRRQPFEPVLARLRQQAAAFGRPVVLAHGDLHQLIIDHPFAETAPMVTRVQTYGSPWVKWIRVQVDPRTPEVFTFEPR
jgi:hypothetical protein